MEPRDLLQALMTRHHENPNSLAAKLKRADPKTKATQPQIHKFLSGASREPRRSTLEPLAAHFGVPVEAFYDPAAAARVAAALRLPGAGEAPAEADTLKPDERLLLESYRALVDPTEKREVLRELEARAAKAQAARELVQQEILAALPPDEREAFENMLKANAYRNAPTVPKEGS